jgi:hypothetical protein
MTMPRSNLNIHGRFKHFEDLRKVDFRCHYRGEEASEALGVILIVYFFSS